MLQRHASLILLFAGCTLACGQAPSTPRNTRADDGDDEQSTEESVDTEPEELADDGDGEESADDAEEPAVELPVEAKPSDKAPDSPPAEPKPAEPKPTATFSFAPSNLSSTPVELAAAPAAVLDCGEVRIDTSVPAKIENWCGTAPTTSTQKQQGGPELLVIALSSLTVAAESRVVVRGPRPVVFLVRGDVAIQGDIDVSAEGATPGAGGDYSCAASTGGDGAGREGRNGGGGGGGGFGSAGGAGGDDDERRSAPGIAGVVRGNEDLVPLLGGCGGGHGGGCAGKPGAGGGALQISAGGALKLAGAIDASGGAGAKGCDDDAGGTGGGSGGGVLLEAQSIDLTGGTIKASGGVGGPGESDGDPGAGATSAKQSGGNGTEDGDGAGAGGGGFGRIRLRSASTCNGC